ncbi:MAG: hypothetical protein OXG64_04040 [Chloroflexi bacterium]|nr:hypothetical protein [Chloroflexota bacterium]
MARQAVIVFPRQWAVQSDDGSLVLSFELATLIEQESDKLENIELIGVFDGMRVQDRYAGVSRAIVDCHGNVLGAVGGSQALDPGQRIADEVAQLLGIARRIVELYKQSNHHKT